MINKIWIYIGAGLGSALAAYLILFMYFQIHNYFLFRKLKMKIPIDKKELADAGKASPLIEKEVEQDERTRQNKFRQFEQLRFIAERERGTPSRSEVIDGIREGVRGEQERGEVSNKATVIPSRPIELD